LFFFLTSLSSSFNDIIEIHFSQWILKPPTCTHSFIHSYIRFIIHCICCWIVYLYLSINDWIMKKKDINVNCWFLFGKNRLWESRTKTKIWKCDGTDSNNKWRF
jgi:hypothetical protein